MGESASKIFRRGWVKLNFVVELNHQNWTLTSFGLASLRFSVLKSSPTSGGGDIKSKFTPNRSDRGENSVAMQKTRWTKIEFEFQLEESSSGSQDEHEPYGNCDFTAQSRAQSCVPTKSYASVVDLTGTPVLPSQETTQPVTQSAFYFFTLFDNFQLQTAVNYILFKLLNCSCNMENRQNWCLLIVVRLKREKSEPTRFLCEIGISLTTSLFCMRSWGILMMLSCDWW